MNILHTITGMGVNSGGTSTCSYHLLKGLNSLGIHADILCFSPAIDDKLIGDESFIRTISSPPSNKLMYSRNFDRFLDSHTEFDLYHANGLWQYPIHATARHARNTHKPYIISPHGMLYPEALQNSKWIKKAYSFLIQNKDLENATVIHATCTQEMNHIRSLGIKTPIALIPNAIDIEIPSKMGPGPNMKKHIGFIGRFAPIKNLEILLEAWAVIEKNNPNWELILIGDGNHVYKNSLIQQVQKLKIKNICFPGFLSGKEKEITLQSLSFLVLPSKSENFGMVIPEALIREIPVIASKGTPWEELNTHHCGWWIENDVETVTKTIEMALDISEDERVKMGMNGKDLIKGKYSIEVVSQKMADLYNWILNSTNKPDFIY